MVDIIRHLVWFGIVATAAFFAIFVVLGDFVTFGAQNANSVVVHDMITPGMHRLSGILMVPLACDELNVGVKELSTDMYDLVFQSWQDPSVACPRTPTPRPFEIVAFTPSVGVTFFATLDGQSFPITVVPDLSTSTAL